MKMKIENCKIIAPLKCSQEDTVVEVAKKFKETTLRHIWIVDEKDMPAGVISLVDMNDRVIAEGKNPNEMKAKDIMTTNIKVFDDEDDLKKAYSVMLKNRWVDAPVLREGKFAGVVTVNDMLNALTRVEDYE